MVEIMKKIAFIAFIINLSLVGVSCGGNMNELLTKSDFSKKWDAMKMSSSETWWYAGSEDKLYFIAIETPFNTSIYTVENTTIRIKGFNEKKYSSDKDNWTIIKIENIEVL